MSIENEHCPGTESSKSHGFTAVSLRKVSCIYVSFEKTLMHANEANWHSENGGTTW